MRTDILASGKTSILLAREDTEGVRAKVVTLATTANEFMSMMF